MTAPKYLDQLRTEWVYAHRRKLFLGVALIMCVFLIILGVLLYRYLVRDNDLKSRELAVTVVSGLKHAMVDRDPAAMQDTVEAIVSGGSSVRRLLILDNDGRVVFSADRKELGKRFDRSTDPSCKVCHNDNLPAGSINTVAVTVDDQRVLRTACVLPNEPACYSCHDASQSKLGMLIIDRSLRDTYDLIGRTLLFFLLFGSAGLASVGYVLNRGAGQYIRAIENQGEELTSLYVMVERLSRSIDRKDLTTIVLEILCDFFKPREIYLVYPKNGGFRCISWSSPEQRVERVKVDANPVLKRAIERWTQNPGLEPEVAVDGMDIMLAVSRSRLPLALVLVNGLPVPFQPRRMWLLRTMADHFGAAFENARLYAIAITDSLTSLYTRRHLDYCSEQLLTKAEERKEPFCLVMMDIDDFKKVNDRYGHPAGDAVLAALGVRILECIRDVDLAFRYGGEEFVLLLPRTSAEEGQIVARRIFDSGPIKANQPESISCTVSMGLAAWPEHATTVSDLVQAADRALYAAKRAGKNRLIVASSPALRDAAVPPPNASPDD